MNSRHLTKPVALLILVALVNSNVAASEIYQWVDENGVSHFSQQPPAKDIQNVTTQTIREPNPGAATEVEDIYDTEAHQERMAQWRKQRDEERKDARDRRDQNAKQQIKYQQPESYGRRPYPYLPIYRPPNRPTYPERPIYNPRPPTTSLSRGG